MADFCPVCHDTRAFQLIRVGMVSHVYYISFGSGKQLGHLIRCQECGADFDTDALRYASIEKQYNGDLAHLEHTTFPRLRETYSTRLELEAQIRQSPHALPPDTRRELLIQPFAILRHAVEARYQRSTEMDKPAGLGRLGTVAVMIVLGFIAANVGPKYSGDVWTAFFSVLALGGLYTFIQIHFAPGRYLQQKVVPQIARALAPLRPHDEEITACLQKCRELGWQIGKKIKPRQVVDAVNLHAATL